MTTTLTLNTSFGANTVAHPSMYRRTVLLVKQEGIEFDVLVQGGFSTSIITPESRQVVYKPSDGSLRFLNTFNEGAKVYVLIEI